MADHEMMSFMDAYSGYNQILMHPDDQKKIAFITRRGIYCFKVIPSGLKNVGATYQRLVNKMFTDFIGDSMEVCIDDMIVKSLKEHDHLNHLRQAFSILRKYGMKLNPVKCSFGGHSSKFLGYLVTKTRIEADPHQIKAVANPVQKTLKKFKNSSGI